MASSEKITELKVTELFAGTDKYIIPLYQRAYAWTDKEIGQLIDDIYIDQSEEAEDKSRNEERSNYYIGSLVVYKRGTPEGSKTDNAIYEVIDGQQRLTTLYLLLKYLKSYTVNDNLEFACRDKAARAFKVLSDETNRETVDEVDDAILRGYNSIEKCLKRYSQEYKDASMDIAEKEKEVIKRFRGNLEQVKLYRIQVPEHTDLNRYFEIMNTRGEQLEQHDILKAELMDALDGVEKQRAFARIWDACSDMTGYVQMHFSAYKTAVQGENGKEKEEKTSERTILFGDKYLNKPDDNTENPKGSLEKLTDFFKHTGGNQVKKEEISEILADDFIVATSDYNNEDNTKVRFESIISFQYFLLHVLRVYVHEKGEGLTKLLDDKNLLAQFDIAQDKYFKDNKKEFAAGFIDCLLKCRFLFDKYIIKREYVGDSNAGNWCLKELKYSSDEDKKKERWYYGSTVFKNADGNMESNDNIMMLQAAYRVSYTSPKIMHWITKLLTHVYENIDVEFGSYENKIEETAKTAVGDWTDYFQGVGTPHIIFNYLDYLLWKKYKDKTDEARKVFYTSNSEGNPVNNFTFEFRNSVEHFYPQNPSYNTIKSWADKSELNIFGNLCIVSGSVNSKFSNLSPAAKVSTFKDLINKGSLKLRIMARLVDDENWDKQKVIDHSNEMLELLKPGKGPFFNSMTKVETAGD